MKKMATLIWRGPFYLGPLQRPVSIGDALLKLFEVIWKAIVAVIALIAGAAAVLYLAQPVPLGDQIKAIAFIGSKNCADPKFPLLVEFRNNSRKNIGLIDFHVHASRINTSTDLVEDYPSYQSDWIIRKGEALSLCYPIPDAVAQIPSGGLQFSVKVNFATEYQGELPPVIHVRAPQR